MQQSTNVPQIDISQLKDTRAAVYAANKTKNLHHTQPKNLQRVCVTLSTQFRELSFINRCVNNSGETNYASTKVLVSVQRPKLYVTNGLPGWFVGKDGESE